MSRSLVARIAAVGTAATLAFGLGACSSGEATAGAEAGAGAAAVAAEDAGIVADLELARQTILSTLEERGELPEIYLASDVKKPEEKYGMLVVPYVPSDATEKLTTSIVKIKGGAFTIGAVSKATGKEYTIDQDGTIAEATK